jgi:aspartyl protease family protein
MAAPRLRTTVLGLLLSAPAAAVGAAPSLEVQGLMRGMVVLAIDGERRVLRVGERTDEGVELLEATPDLARVRVGDQVLELGLSRRAGARYVEPQEQTVRVAADRSGHYRIAGQVEGQPVSFLVDTGATVLALSSRQAETLGIDYRGRGRTGQVTTAAGPAVSHLLTLESVEVGGIRVEGVEAAVVEGAYPQEPLLGMSFLRRIGLAESNGVMTLTQRR